MASALDTFTARTTSSRNSKGLPTNFRKESDPFASLSDVIQQQRRDSSLQEPPSLQDLEDYRKASTAGQASRTELQPDNWNESTAEIACRGPPTPDIVSSTTHLVQGQQAQQQE
ncbi:MAG: hypothetical protein Q9207_001279 [Kuettlingeria erythrocarpa]